MSIASAVCSSVTPPSAITVISMRPSASAAREACRRSSTPIRLKLAIISPPMPRSASRVRLFLPPRATAVARRARVDPRLIGRVGAASSASKSMSASSSLSGRALPATAFFFACAVCCLAAQHFALLPLGRLAVESGPSSTVSSAASRAVEDDLLRGAIGGRVSRDGRQRGVVCALRLQEVRGKLEFAGPPTKKAGEVHVSFYRVGAQ